MIVLKCKMCGGDLRLEEGVTVAECEYCGTRQTVPTVDDEKKLTLFGRANRLRLACEFDKAAGVYEAIVADFPDEAEAYWGLVLCKYGIEYVDDPATAKKIPTCHRSSFDSVMGDADFEQVMENADATARMVYREEAKRIEELRRGIVAVSSAEEPYDIFICYKETDANGDRTVDSEIAQDVYTALTERGYRVFFARISLEDKLGQAYEPYIFAALNSAKIMLVFGTDYEYFNAVWVKNEWSRFLQLIAKGESKTLIPCYKGVDAYDIPKEFAKLQAQDMGKVGALQDLLRGIEKILPRTVQTQAVVQQATAPVTAPANNATVDSLLKRAFMFLEDRDWKSADEYCEKVLDIDPECAKAYLGKLMVELQVSKQENLKQCDAPFDDSNNYQKAIRFADEALASMLKGYNETIVERQRERERADEERKRADEERERAEKERKRAELAPLIKRSEKASKWISAGLYHTVGVKTDGTVVACGDNDDGQCNVSDWRDMVAVAAGLCHTIGLRSDGTVVACGRNKDGQCNVSGWRDIVAVAAGSYHTIGLRSDGTVVACGSNLDGKCNVSGWRDIVAVAAGYHTIGLRSNGTVVACGDNKYGQCDVSDWCDIVAVVASGCYTIGLRSDSTVVACGANAHGQCNVSGWRDVVAVAAGSSHTIGLRSDGTVVACGDNVFDQCNVSDWRLFNRIDTVEDDRAEHKRLQLQRAEQERLQREEQERLQHLQAERRASGVCQHCGGAFKGMFTKKCSNCGTVKDY